MGTLIVHRSNRVEKLADALALLLEGASEDPFAADTVVVHGRGMERWLSHRIAGHLGICANVRFPFPRHMLQDVFESTLGTTAPSPDPWSAPNLTWHILEALPELLEHAAFAPLHGYLQESSPSIDRREYLLARQVADVFDRLVTYRPEWARSWTRNDDPNDETWQPILFRAVRQSLGKPHLAELAQATIEHLDEDGPLDLGSLPDRIAFFGLSTVPPIYLEVLRALSKHREIHLFLLCPSDTAWKRVTNLGIRGVRSRSLSAEEHEAIRAEAGHPLLASMGRLGRDLQLVLEDLEPAPPYRSAETNLFSIPDTSESSPILHRLQSDILHGRPTAPGTSDPSIRVLGCHGGIRQVEALRDEFLDLFQADPSLQPRHIAVLCPDIETYAPLIHAVFSDQGTPDIPFLPFRVTDRRGSRVNRAAEALFAVLELTEKRATVSEILDIIGLEAIRDRFNFRQDDTARLDRWFRKAGVCWGIDGKHRKHAGLPEDNAHTWQFGIQRLLLGVALPSDGPNVLGGLHPDDTASDPDGIALLARFTQFFDTLTSILDGARTVRLPAEWAALLHEWIDRLVDTDDARAREVADLRSAVDEVRKAPGTRSLSLDAVLAALDDRLRSRPDVGGLESGAITFCAMVPMRSIPFRVVALLGMDEGTFPRGEPRVGFDLTTQMSRVGDRSPREDDRTLFLEAVLAARERLIITYTARSRSGPRHPCVPVVELLESLPGEHTPQAIVPTSEPAQPFNPDAYGSRGARPSYDPRFLEAARALVQERREPTPIFDRPMPPPEGAVDLEDLCRFFRNPAEVILKDRLGIRLIRDRSEDSEEVPIRPVELDRWETGHQALRWAVEGEHRLDRLEAGLRGAGLLPAGHLGSSAFREQGPELVALAHAVEDLLGEEETDLNLQVELETDEGPTSVTGRIENVGAGHLVLYRAGKVKPPQQLDAWIRHLFLAAAGAPRTTILLGQPTGTSADRTELVAIDDPREARRLLKDLVDLYRSGYLIPFAPQTSRVEAQGKSQLAQAWHSGPKTRGEGTDIHFRHILGDTDLWTDEAARLLGLPPELNFSGVARQVWAPYLERTGKSS